MGWKVFIIFRWIDIYVLSCERWERVFVLGIGLMISDNGERGSVEYVLFFL